MQLHLDYCREFGLTADEMKEQPESVANVAYSRFILDIGSQQDWLALQVAMAPCLIGYGEIAQALYDSSDTVRENNRYYKWIQNYVAPDYKQAVCVGRELLEKHAVRQSPSRIEELVDIFAAATRFETSFWSMGQEN